MLNGTHLCLFISFCEVLIMWVSYEYFGDNETATDFINRGDIETGDFSTWWLNNNRVVAAFIISSRPQDEKEKAGEWIRKKTRVEKDKIGDENIPLKNIELN